MTTSRRECPVCGSLNVSSKTTTRTIGIPFVGQKIVSIFVDLCTNCGQSGDFFRRNTPIIEDAIHSAEQEFVARTVEWLNERGIPMAYVERVLSLPARTIIRWRDGEFSAAPIALLRLVRTCPWLLTVAEAAFDPGVAASAVVGASAEVIGAARAPSVSRTSSAITNLNLTFVVQSQRSDLPTQVAKPTFKVMPPNENN